MTTLTNKSNPPRYFGTFSGSPYRAIEMHGTSGVTVSTIVLPIGTRPGDPLI